MRVSLRYSARSIIDDPNSMCMLMYSAQSQNNKYQIIDSHNMQAGRQRNNDTKMRGCLNLENKLTDIYLPRKCDFTDRVVTSKDHSSIQLNICDVNADGTINLGKSSIVTISGFVRSTGQGDAALQKVLGEKRLI